MSDFFGYCNADGSNKAGSNWDLAGYSFQYRGYTTDMICPGSGARTIEDLSVYCYRNPAGAMKIAIYDTENNLVVYGTNPKSTPTSAAWLTWAAGDLTWVVGTALTGGVTYRLAFASQTSSAIFYDTGSSGDTVFVSAGYAAFPDAVYPAGTDRGERYAIRCGVAAVGGLSIPVAMLNQRYKRI